MSFKRSVRRAWATEAKRKYRAEMKAIKRARAEARLVEKARAIGPSLKEVPDVKVSEKSS
jgi:hypothetical protein